MLCTTSEVSSGWHGLASSAQLCSTSPVVSTRLAEQSSPAGSVRPRNDRASFLCISLHEDERNRGSGIYRLPPRFTSRLAVLHPTIPLSTHKTGGPKRYLSMVILGFQQPAVSISYIIAMDPFGLHLNHGASSLFKSLGLRNSKYNNMLDKAGSGHHDCCGWKCYNANCHLNRHHWQRKAVGGH